MRWQMRVQNTRTQAWWGRNRGNAWVKYVRRWYRIYAIWRRYWRRQWEIAGHLRVSRRSWHLLANHGLPERVLHLHVEHGRYLHRIVHLLLHVRLHVRVTTCDCICAKVRQCRELWEERQLWEFR